MERRYVHEDAACLAQMAKPAYRQWVDEFVAAHRSPVLSWTCEARAMLPAVPKNMSQRDLAMLAAMIERGGLAMLPASALSDFVVQSLERLVDGRPRTHLAEDVLRDMLAHILLQGRADPAFDAIHGMISSLIMPLALPDQGGRGSRGRLAA